MSSFKENLNEKTEGIKKSYADTKKGLQDDIAETKQSISKSVETGKKAVSSFFKKLMWTALILGILAGIGFILYANMNFSVGSRTGELIKISEKGVMFKTYEGLLNQGGIQVNDNIKNEPSLTSLWEFSVTDKDVYEKMNLLRGKKVIITYTEKYVALPWRGDTKYLVTEVQEN